MQIILAHRVASESEPLLTEGFRSQTSHIDQPSDAISSHPSLSTHRRMFPPAGAMKPRCVAIVKAEVGDFGLRQRSLPGCVGQLPKNRLPFIGETETRMLATLFLEYLQCVVVQGHAPWSAVLGLVQPSCTPISRNPGPFKLLDF